MILSDPNQARSPKITAALTLGALGVVYGDIGTSPLYALRECFGGEHHLRVDAANVLGILSLVFWALTLVVTRSTWHTCCAPTTAARAACWR